jgi:translation initiation factor 1
MNNSRLVYSTESGRICPSCEQPAAKCICKKKKTKSHATVNYDDVIRIRREVKGRKGKMVTTVSGFQIDADDLQNLAAQLKRRCGAGGSVKDRIIIIQGDHREILLSELKKRGYTVKLAGG